MRSMKWVEYKFAGTCGETNLVMAISCEAGKPLTWTKGNKRSDAKPVFTRNIFLTSLVQNLGLKLYYMLWQETILSNTADLIPT